MILRVNMYITCQIGLKLEIDQNRLKSVKSNWFYEFDRVWPISSFNPQKLKIYCLPVRVPWHSTT
jgi:hypothetical protein